MKAIFRARQGFTLIELLIVVAIIAILAAIAVPNFLEAQTRSKVSRAKADIRTLATCVESYCVDQNEYPYPSNEANVLEVPPVAEPLETRMSPLLTTPVSYITSLLNEPFPAQGDPESPQFHYSTRKYFEDFDLAGGGTGSSTGLDQYVTAIFGSPMTTLKYFILSHGPDHVHDNPDDGRVACLYDPTNGTTSAGDVIYWGPSTGFKN